MSNTPITIDLTYLYSLTGGDKPFEQMLLSGAVTDIDNIVGDLKLSWELGNGAGIRKNAHLLVSLAAIGGMPEVANWSRQIDQAFADNILHPELAPLTNKIISGWPAAKLQLEKLIAHPAS